MTAGNRKPRSDSVAAAIEVFKHAKQDLQPSIKLNAREMTYFQSILTDREATSWSPNHLVIATNLARTYAAIDQLWEVLNTEGMTNVNQRGTVVTNPAISSLNMMTGTAQNLNRLLGLSASQKGVGLTDRPQSNNLAREANSVSKGIEDDELLAS